MSVAKWDFLDMELTLIHLTLIKVYFKSSFLRNDCRQVILQVTKVAIYNHFKRKITYSWRVYRHTEKSQPPDSVVLMSHERRVAHHTTRITTAARFSVFVTWAWLLSLMPTVLWQRKQIAGRPEGTLTCSLRWRWPPHKPSTLWACLFHTDLDLNLCPTPGRSSNRWYLVCRNQRVDPCWRSGWVWNKRALHFTTGMPSFDSSHAWGPYY